MFSESDKRGITSDSLHKLPIYANFNVPEIWRYDGQKLTVFILKKEENIYQEVDKSKAFPFLILSIIPALIEQSLIIGETAVFRKFRQQVREDFNKYN
jgi:Uma2 family endonuclease